MAFTKNSIRRIDFIPHMDGTAGENRSIWVYMTNDDTSAIETAGYFNSYWQSMKKGDIMFISLDLDGTPLLRSYIVAAASSSGVTITKQSVA